MERRQHVAYMKYENRTKHPPPPKIALSLVPCIINRGLSHETSLLRWEGWDISFPLSYETQQHCD